VATRMAQALAFGVVLLVASIPIAMQVVCTATMALGSSKLAEQKAIVSRLASIEELASMNMLCSDKTYAPSVCIGCAAFVCPPCVFRRTPQLRCRCTHRFHWCWSWGLNVEVNGLAWGRTAAP
jgi:hypothetical protein